MARTLSEAERWKLPPTVDEGSEWGGWQTFPGLSGPGKDLDIIGSWCLLAPGPLSKVTPG